MNTLQHHLFKSKLFQIANIQFLVQLKLIFIYLLFTAHFLYSADENVSKKNELSKLELIENALESINKKLSPENSIWLKSYSNYNLYLEIEKKLEKIEKDIVKYGEIKNLVNNRELLTQQLQLFGEHVSPFEKLLQPPTVEPSQIISNPFAIISAFSKINQNNQHRQNYLKRYEDLNKIVSLLQDRLKYLTQKDDMDNATLKALKREITDFEIALSTIEKTLEIFNRKIDEVNLEIKDRIAEHSKTLISLGITIAVIIALSFLSKWLIGRYLKDNRRIYMSNKAVNVIMITIIFFIILFTYLENINNIVTILGFASAGLAIAMKDGFTSFFAWFVIIFGGIIKVGDRIKVSMSGNTYVGDILDISLLRITLQEDITFTSYETNRRAGRIIFVPNSYIFSNIIANYTHYTLRTVWDGIDIMITFDSNHKKASHIMKEIVKTFASGYTDMTRTQLNSLRDKYDLRNTNVEPRMFTFIDTYGIKLSIWYLTNAYGTLILRSNISAKIIDAFNAESDIKIAFPTQTINIVSKNVQDSPNNININ